MDAADLLAIEIAPFEQSYGPRDRVVYALALGLGHRFTDPWALDYVREEQGRALPTFAAALGRPPDWMRWPQILPYAARTLHGGQRLVCERPLPPQGRVRVDHRVVQVADKGEGRGAVVVVERRLSDPADGALFSVLHWVLLCRDAGGIGSAGEPVMEEVPLPPAGALERKAVLEVSLDAALLYRLAGDLNPIHSDPEAARAAGFPRPLVHGLWTYGAVAAEAMRLYGLERLRSLDARFSAPAFPGDRLEVEFWTVGEAIAFRCRAPERESLVIDRGLLRPA